MKARKFTVAEAFGSIVEKEKATKRKLEQEVEQSKQASFAIMRELGDRCGDRRLEIDCKPDVSGEVREVWVAGEHIGTWRVATEGAIEYFPREPLTKKRATGADQAVTQTAEAVHEWQKWRQSPDWRE